MKKTLLVATVFVVYLLHQDCWNWKSIHPLAFGFLPVGLTYHVGYSIAASILMAILVRHAWPQELEREESAPENPELKRGGSQ